MRATLFFAMLKQGRVIHFRKKSREYFEFCRIVQYPNMTQASQTETLQWYWDGSLHPIDRARRDDFISQVKQGESKNYMSTHEVLDVFKKRHR